MGLKDYFLSVAPDGVAFWAAKFFLFADIYFVADRELSELLIFSFNSSFSRSVFSFLDTSLFFLSVPGSYYEGGGPK